MNQKIRELGAQRIILLLKPYRASLVDREKQAQVLQQLILAACMDSVTLDFKASDLKASQIFKDLEKQFKRYLGN